MEYNLLIVEDDEIQRRNLKLMLGEISEEFIIFEADSIKGATTILNDHNIDLFYLDQNLPDGSGIDLGKKIRGIGKYKLTWIIFLTSHVQYMLEAFKEIHCYDYVLKPYNKNNIKALTLELVKGLRKSRLASSSNENPSINFDINGITLKLYADQIYFIEVKLRTCFIHTKAGIYKVQRMPLTEMIDKLPKGNFIQSHRAYLVNINHVSGIFEDRGESLLSFKNYDETALIGRTFKSKLIESIKNNNITI